MRPPTSLPAYQFCTGIRCPAHAFWPLWLSGSGTGVPAFCCPVAATEETYPQIDVMHPETGPSANPIPNPPHASCAARTGAGSTPATSLFVSRYCTHARTFRGAPI
jgi:hypothetical protein